jgi:Zn-dependent peptidase ImmA (M78 family)/transcriptional regulator with XRE-family HTH domain
MSEPNRELIVLAREAREYTQEALAESIGVAQGTISKVENGQAIASDDLLQKISARLGFPLAFFFQELRTNELPSSFFRRRLTEISQKTIKAVRARWSILVRGLRVLLSAVEFPESRVPSFDLATLGIGSADAAQRTRLHWRVPIGPVANVTALVEFMGVLVVPFDFGSDRIDGMSIHDRSLGLPPVILVNKTIPGDRQRFTILHELGHLVLHSHLSPNFEDRALEHEADIFASEFLLPSDSIRGHLVSISLPILFGLKLHWKASIQALLMKADSLDMISESHKQRLWSTLSKRGWKRVEPNPIPREEPALLRQLVQLHEERLGYSEEELCSILCNISREDFRALYPTTKLAGLKLVQ